jgi:hypothetical protein
MTPRGSPTPTGGEAQGLHPDDGARKSPAPQREEMVDAPEDRPWLRQIVYLCAATGLALAILYLIKPPPVNRLPVSTHTCGPCCR